MKKSSKKKMQVALAWLAGMGLIVPQVSYATDARPAGTAAVEQRTVLPVADVALGEQGTLQGRVIDQTGVVRGGVEVGVRRGPVTLAVAQTDADGRFVISGMRAGIYEIAADGGGGFFRVWASGTAPPVATGNVELRIDTGVVRGQGLNGWRRAAVLGGIVVSAGVIGGVIGYNIRDFNPSS